jgi:hypothetical protein
MLTIQSSDAQPTEPKYGLFAALMVVILAPVGISIYSATRRPALRRSM